MESLEPLKPPTMSHSRLPATDFVGGDSLPEGDVRMIVRLMGDTVAVKGGHGERKRFLMGGLCRLIGANAWVWGMACNWQDRHHCSWTALTHDGFSDVGFSAYFKASQHPISDAIINPFFDQVRSANTHLTRRLDQIDPEDMFHTRNVAPLWHSANVGAMLFSVLPFGSNSASGIVICRRPGLPPFDVRETRIAHIILSEVSWLHTDGWPEESSTSRVRFLTRREQAVLNLLLEGCSRKEIASHLTLSAHTVAQYQKSIYRQLAVRSHPELICRFFNGDGGDR